MYYTSAAYELHGFGGNVLERVVDIILHNLPGIIMGIAHFLVCLGFEFDCEEIATTGWLNVGCGISGAAITLMDWEDITENAKFNDYDYDIGADQCSGIA
ncbi:hypothetical protein J4209_04000 [Candidatus Woesearchaeota archaeon]|nr:hypothetical protein [Candidatus Woesearchaeota archaeon]